MVHLGRSLRWDAIANDLIASYTLSCLDVWRYSSSGSGLIVPNKDSAMPIIAVPRGWYPSCWCPGSNIALPEHQHPRHPPWKSLMIQIISVIIIAILLSRWPSCWCPAPKLYHQGISTQDIGCESPLRSKLSSSNMEGTSALALCKSGHQLGV